MMNIYIHHTIFTHFTEINKKNYPHQSEHNIITTPTEVDKYTQSTSCPFTILQQHKFTTVITLFVNIPSVVCLLNSPSYCPNLKFLTNDMLVARKGCAALSPAGLMI